MIPSDYDFNGPREDRLSKAVGNFGSQPAEERSQRCENEVLTPLNFKSNSSQLSEPRKKEQPK